MNIKTAKILCKINNDFYRNQCVSFSATRKSPWTGWQRCLDVLKNANSDNYQNFSVFDLACGNLRFEAFLEAAFVEANITFYAVDNCNELVPRTPLVNYQSLDVLSVLQKGLCVSNQIEAPVCDISVSFGFMHHVPLRDYRDAILSTLVEQTHSGGYVIVSFWQFLKNEFMAEKAQITHKRALEELALPELEENDYLLGWKDIPGQYRYCHSFSEADIDLLIGSVANKATVAARFVSDGRTDNLNSYLILKVL